MSRLATLAERLYQARKAKRLSREALAGLSGQCSRTIDRYEKGEQTPSACRLLSIAEHLGVSVSWLIGEEGQVDTPPPAVLTAGPGASPPQPRDARPNLFSLVANILALSPEDRAALLRLLQSEAQTA